MRIAWGVAALGAGLIMLGAFLAPPRVYSPVEDSIDNGKQPAEVEGRWMCLEVPSNETVRIFLRNNGLSTSDWWYLTSCASEPIGVAGNPTAAMAALNEHAGPFWYAPGADRITSMPIECTVEGQAPADVVTCLSAPRIDP